MDSPNASEAQSVEECLRAFLQQPGRESFLRVRETVIASPAHAPYSHHAQEMAVLAKRGDLDGAFKLLSDSFPNLILSPFAHAALSIAHEKKGDEQASRFERAVCSLCLEGIMSTGQGTKESPYLVTLIQDEYDVLQYLGRESTMQALVEVGEGQHDVMTLEDGTEVHFDITDCYGKNLSRAAGPPEMAEPPDGAGEAENTSQSGT